MAIITKFHRLQALHDKNVFSHISRGWNFKIKVFPGLFSSEASLLN